MKLIKIINGTYGYRPAKSKFVEPKQAGDPPFDVEDGEAERLVSLGVAAYVRDTTIENKPEKPVATPPNGRNGTETDITPLNQNDGSEGAGDEQEKVAYSVDMKASELRDMMEKFGLVYKVGMTKADMVAALDEYFSGEEVEDGEAPPNLTAEEPVT